MVVPFSVRNSSNFVPWRNCPPHTEASSAATPKTLMTARPLPLWPTPRMPSPIRTAMGIVQAMVKRPHGLSASAFTTTSASTASRITMIATMLTSAMLPANGPTSSRTICPRDFPRRRVEQNRITESWTAPPIVAPTSIHNMPGK